MCACRSEVIYLTGGDCFYCLLYLLHHTVAAGSACVAYVVARFVAVASRKNSSL